MTTPTLTDTTTDRPTSLPTLIYVYDAMCSWCFGFEPVVASQVQANADKLRLQVVSGGMNVGAGVARIKDILGADPMPAYRRVIETSGAPIGPAYLEGLVARDNYLVDSLRPSIALAAFRADPANAGRELEFATAMQTAMYVGGIDPSSDEYYRSAAQAVGIDADALLAAMQTTEARESAEADFALTQALGVRGFPAVFLTDGATYVQLTAGYTPEDVLAANIAEGLRLLGRKVVLPTAQGEQCVDGVCDVPGSGA